ncbi:MAG: hypothetical protein ACHQYP_09030, partial [Nitrospiria bacterium]
PGVQIKNPASLRSDDLENWPRTTGRFGSESLVSLKPEWMVTFTGIRSKPIEFAFMSALCATFFCFLDQRYLIW